MKQSNINTLMGLGLLSIGGYFLIKRYLDSKQSDKTDEEEGLDVQAKDEIQIQETNSSVTSGDYIKKKKTLQELLGFTGSDVDGAIGPKTKTALAKAGVTKEVTPSNIDSIIKSIQSKATKTTKDSARVKRAKEVVKAASFSKTYTWTDNATKLKLYQKDKLGKYNFTGSVYPVAKNQQIVGVTKQTVLSSGFIRCIIKVRTGWGSSVERYVYISPYSVTVY